MKLLIGVVVVGFLASCGAVYAACTNTTIMDNGRLKTCTSCCDGYGNCTISCY